jgi:predicted nucleic acid-binding protein
MYTTDYVVDETITLLTIRTDVRRSLDAYDGIETAANSGFLRFERITEPRFQATLDLRRRYADKPDISFTDLSSMVVMEERGIRDVLSGDAHFEHVGLGFRRRPEPET